MSTRLCHVVIDSNDVQLHAPGRTPSTAGGETRFALGDPLVDSYLAFVAGRSRPNTLRAVAHDLKTFFSIIDNANLEALTGAFDSGIVNPVSEGVS